MTGIGNLPRDTEGKIEHIFDSILSSADTVTNDMLSALISCQKCQTYIKHNLN